MVQGAAESGPPPIKQEGTQCLQTLLGCAAPHGEKPSASAPSSQGDGMLLEGALLTYLYHHPSVVQTQTR